MEPPSVNELLDWCSKDPKPWELYQKGCTLCLNQVEKTGTSARVGVYKPTNISELCAFVAAIRPGFKSMYKIFESRQPFSYGVKAFDELIQTPEMPNSFVLYQEQEMEALHYAGIPMSECYTAIKNIAKKRKEKVLAYEEKFKAGFNKTMIEDEHKTPEEAEVLSSQLWQIITDASSYSFNSAHAYCVALDSLYEAWLKANHPLEFYEVALKIYEKKGNKDKMNALKEEAENYFNIRFPAFRFGQDNRSIQADHEHNTINNSMVSIKGFSKGLAQSLYECGLETHPDFFSVLDWLDKRSIKSAKVIPLIKIDYFQNFGNNAELLRLVAFYDYFKQGTAKSIKKEKITNETLEQFVARHGTDKGAKGNELKSYTITDMPGLLNEIESYIMSLHMPELPYRVRIKNQEEVLGYVDITTNKEEDRRKLYILEVYAIQNRWGQAGGVWKYKVKTKSVGSGKVSSLSLEPNRMKAAPIQPGDIIYANNVFKDKKGYWNLVSYDLILD